MKNRKINLDRPQLSSKEIQANKNFDQVLSNYNIISKPFYKSNWFIGTTGLASIGLIIGGSFAFQNPDQLESSNQNLMNTEAPPDLIVPDNSLISMSVDYNDLSKDLVKEAIGQNITNNETYEETFTLETDDIQITEEDLQNDLELTVISNEDDIDTDIESVESLGFSMMDLSPRISGKLEGSITKEELFDNKGITTESDVSVIHFELHLIDGLGGKVFEEEGNQLSEEMKEALKKIGQGDEIYFENIEGETTDGAVVRLNPLRYVLMN